MPTILHVCYPTELYGAEQSLLLLVEGLARRGYRSVVAVPHSGPLVDRLEALKVPVVYVPFRPWLTDYHKGIKRKLYNLYHLPFLFRATIAVLKIIRHYQVDLIHTTNSVVFDGALAANISGVPHVWHIREAIEPGGFLKFSFGFKLARCLIKLFSSRIIVISKGIGRFYLNRSSDANKVRVIYNAIDLSLYDRNSDPKDIRQILEIPANAKIVGMVGQMRPWKRHEDFLRAGVIVKQAVPDVFFLVVGGDFDTHDEYGPRIRDLSSELGLEEQIAWLGFYDNIGQVFNIMDLFVLPSETEAFGRVLIEAMSLSKPVVATTVGGIPEIVVDDVTGLLVPPRSPEKLAQAIIKILKDPSLAAAMGKAGRQRVENHFTVEKYIDNIVALYQELL